MTNLRPVETLEESAVLLMTTLGRFMLDLSKLKIRKFKKHIPESLLNRNSEWLLRKKFALFWIRNFSEELFRSKITLRKFFLSQKILHFL